jgi:pimeloyl-ACP methyl ester carboxylesterase
MAAPALAPLLVPAEPPSAAGWGELALTRIGAVLDRAMLAGMRLAFAEVLRPAGAISFEETAQPYLDPMLQRDPRRFFTFLDEPADDPVVRTIERRDVPGGVIAVHEIASDYVPWHTSESWPVCPENERIPIEHWHHRGGEARAVIVALHGFTMGRPWIDGRVLMASQWFTRGYDVVMPVLPFHGVRAPCTTRYSGEAFGSWDVRRLNEAVRQAIHDVDIVRRWLVAETRLPVGLVGLSLGGYLTALLAGLRPDLAFAVPVAAPSSLAWLPHRLFGLGGTTAVRPPVAADVLDAAYRVHSPLSFPLAIPRERAFIVGGLGDGLVPREQVEGLWRHWGEPALHWFSGGHSTPFGRARVMARIDEHLRAVL